MIFASWGPSGGVLEASEAIREASWAIMEAYWRSSWAIRSHFGSHHPT